MFALAPTFEIAAAGRTLVGIGVSVAFIAVLKSSADWFPANRFATLSGTTMLAGNLGAVIAGAPLAWIDRGSSAGDINSAWQQGLLLMAAAAALGALMPMLVADQPYRTA